MTEKRGGGKGPVGEHGETDLEVSLVDNVLVLESIEGDLTGSKEKFSSNISAMIVVICQGQLQQNQHPKGFWLSVTDDEVVKQAGVVDVYQSRLHRRWMGSTWRDTTRAGRRVVSSGPDLGGKWAFHGAHKAQGIRRARQGRWCVRGGSLWTVETDPCLEGRECRRSAEK